jgi:hypothetical protein
MGRGIISGLELLSGRGWGPTSSATSQNRGAFHRPHQFTYAALVPARRADGEPVVCAPRWSAPQPTELQARAVERILQRAYPTRRPGTPRHPAAAAQGLGRDRRHRPGSPQDYTLDSKLSERHNCAFS